SAALTTKTMAPVLAQGTRPDITESQVSGPRSLTRSLDVHELYVGGHEGEVKAIRSAGAWPASDCPLTNTFFAASHPCRVPEDGPASQNGFERTIRRVRRHRARRRAR